MIGNQATETTEHFRVVRTVVGINGVGGAWIKEEWFWRSGGLCRTETRTLTPEETAAYGLREVLT